MSLLRYIWLLFLLFSYCFFVASGLSPNAWFQATLATPRPSAKSSDEGGDRTSTRTSTNITDIPSSYDEWRAQAGPVSPEPAKRAALMKYGARVACWPSSGGVWIKDANLLDMEFLKVDRDYDTDQQFDPAAEYAFCTSLKMLGANWYRLPPRFENRKHLGKDQFACQTLETCFEPNIKNKFLIAWLVGESQACYVFVDRAMRNTDNTINAYHNSLSMDERCNAILRLGGELCRCKEECPELEDFEWGYMDGICIDLTGMDPKDEL